MHWPSRNEEEPTRGNPAGLTHSPAPFEPVELEVMADDDGELLEAAASVPENLRPVIENEEAARRRKQSILRGEITYETGSRDRPVRVTVSHLEADDSNRFLYKIERSEPAPGVRLETRSDRDIIGEDIINALPDAVVMTDLGGGIVFANRSAVELVGADSLEKLLGRPIWSFIHPEDLTSARREGWLVQGGKPVEYVRHRVVRVDGRTVPVEIVTRRTRYRGHPVILISAHDLTGIQTIEQALEETQQLFYRVFKTGPLAISVSRLTDRILIDVNDAFCEMVGHTREALVNRSPEEAGLVIDSDKLEEMYARVLTEGAISEVELNVRDARGQRRILLMSASRIDAQGEPCMLTMGTDITERKRSSLALKESEERFRTLADSAPVLMWLADPDKQFTYFNRQWLVFTGRLMQEEMGAGWTQNVHPDDAERCLNVYSAAFDRREAFTMEFRLRRHDGVYRWMLDRGVPRFLMDGTFIGFIGSCIDITDRKLAEQKLLLSKQQSEEMAILKSAFLTNMTHEIRTPLTVILGFTSILKQGTRREYQRFVNLIERSGRRLLLMLDSVLDLAQLEAGTLAVEPGRHNISDITHGVVTALLPIAEDKDLYLEFENPGTAFYAYVDSAVLSRVLNNLLDNAIKFTESGGVRVWLEENAHLVMIHIDDSGIGIDERFLPHVFDAFSQESTGIERTHQGSGLGLTVSKQLLNLLDGDLILTSDKGKGSSVTVSLPKQ